MVCAPACRDLQRFRSFAFYEPLRCAYRESYGHARPGSSGSPPSLSHVPTCTCFMICHALSYVCLYIYRLPRTHPLRRRLRRRPGYIRTCRCAYLILEICVYYITAPHGSQGDSRESRRLLTGVSATRTSSPTGATSGAPAAPPPYAVGRLYLYPHMCIDSYTHWYMCVHITAPHGSRDDSREQRRLLTGVTTSL